MSTTPEGIFTPKSDDTYAAAHTLWDVATVKDSGYLHPRGTFAEGQVPEVAAALTVYLAERGRENQNVYVRPVGALTWSDVTMTSPFTVTVPDSLPEGFEG